MALRVEPGFVKADGGNIPRVTQEMIAHYCVNNANFLSAEFKGVKLMRSSRESYGDAAVGYVQVKQDGTIHTCKARLTPEHKVRAKGYEVTVQVNGASSEVMQATCSDCAASRGGCKHSIAFLFWLHRRSEEKSVTEVACYWKKSELSKVGSTNKFIKLSELTTVPIVRTPDSAIVASKFREDYEQKTPNCTYLQLQTKTRFATLSIHQLLCFFFKEDTSGLGAEHFIEYCKKHMQVAQCSEATESTQSQSGTILWHELRYGRITASRLYEVSRCRTTQGSLVQQIFGATKFIPTEAMARGLQLEDAVIKEVEKMLGIKSKKCGLVLNPQMPIFGASPDGITDTSIIEVKCPQNNVETFVKNNEITPKCVAQMQLQMKMCGKLHAIFAVADPKFETNKIVHIHYLDYSENLCDKLISDATNFWINFIYPVLPHQ